MNTKANFVVPAFSVLRTGLFAALVAGLASGCSKAPAPTATLEQTAFAQPAPATAFIDDYLSNTTDNLSHDSNAVIRILSGMNQLWRTGEQWNNGTPIDADTTRRNIQYVVTTTLSRSAAQTRQAYIYDRQHQSHGVIDGLGPLAPLYRQGAWAVSAIQTLPETIPASRVDDAVPADAASGAQLGAGASAAPLGKVADWVHQVRGPHSSSNPAKYTFQYPRPWRMSDDNRVLDTGSVDSMGFPVYEANSFVLPQLLRQRGDNPATDGGFPSGHTNAAYLSALALAYAIPERFQELMVRAAELGHSRIEAGMHSPLDVIGGRIMATAIFAAVLNDPNYAELRDAARQQSLDYFAAHIANEQGLATNTLLQRFAHSNAAQDAYGDRLRNQAFVRETLTYILPKHAVANNHMQVPKGAEAILATRFPYLSAEQRRDLLQSTALDAGYPLLDNAEPWGRLNLFAAADGYGRIDSQLHVVMDKQQGGFHAEDHWRNDIQGTGTLIKEGSGTLILSGNNRYSGGTHIAAGNIIAAGVTALGDGPLHIGSEAKLQVSENLTSLFVSGDTQVQGQIHLHLHNHPQPALVIGGQLHIAPEAQLHLQGTPGQQPLIKAQRINGRFAKATYNGAPVALQYEQGLVQLAP